MPYFNLLIVAGIIVLLGCQGRAQQVPDRLRTSYPPLNDRLSRMVTADSTVVSPAEARSLEGAVYLDAREEAEYAVSHLPDARHLGYDDPRYDMVEDLDADTPLVVYCTIGYRSERAAEELRSRGFKEVYNLYGSIYAWRLAGLPIVDGRGQPTDRIHTYNKKWGGYLPDSAAVKVY